MSLFYFFLIIFLILLSLEIITPGTFIFFSFSIAALITSFFTFSIKNTNILMFIFSIFSIITIFLSKKYLNNFIKTNDTKTNIDNYIGQQVKVLKKLDNNNYRIKIYSEEWNAISNSDLKKDDIAIIIKKEGNHLIIKEAHNNE
ncbi:membrane protein implicated in regulation of membrane protease activity [Hypnocyclicus thermotrophus]|uniref:Membrane protein implicated in regulation of membrane protease activity n=2 Tax=Hypnocyclicus thermotrophus TaxID=1627895 RepID=A0AA46DZF6_9FUSO|nr:membrane protein implicated in regulation of membrane protease activity [Hypnocyclicus thermotrophus]